MYDLDELLPHRGRMKLLDAITGIDAEGGSAVARVKPRWPLCEGDTADAIVGIELIAQTIAAWDVFHKGLSEGRRDLGMIVAIKSARLHAARFAIGRELSIEVKKVYDMGFFSMFEGTVRDGAAPGVQAMLQVYRLADRDELLQPAE